MLTSALLRGRTLGSDSYMSKGRLRFEATRARRWRSSGSERAPKLQAPRSPPIVYHRKADWCRPKNQGMTFLRVPRSPPKSHPLPQEDFRTALETRSPGLRACKNTGFEHWGGVFQSRSKILLGGEGVGFRRLQEPPMYKRPLAVVRIPGATTATLTHLGISRGLRRSGSNFDPG